MTTLFNTLGGRKFTVGLLSMVLVFVLALVKDIDVDKILNAILTLSGIATAGIAVENSANAILKRKETPNAEAPKE